MKLVFMLDFWGVDLYSSMEFANAIFGHVTTAVGCDQGKQVNP